MKIVFALTDYNIYHYYDYYYHYHIVLIPTFKNEKPHSEGVMQQSLYQLSYYQGITQFHPLTLGPNITWALVY